MELPSIAIGKDYLGRQLAGRAPSGSGFQLSLFGLLGILVSRVEGIEINVLGLSWGFNPFTLTLKLPMIGRLGLPRTTVRDQHAQEMPEVAEVADS